MKASVLILAAAVALPTAPALAQKATADGMTLAKFQERERTRIMALDTNGDGKVSQAEWAADTKRQPKNFAAIDANGDGQIDAGEIDARTAKRFAKMDADGNGVVTREEQQAINKPSSN